MVSNSSYSCGISSYSSGCVSSSYNNSSYSCGISSVSGSIVSSSSSGSSSSSFCGK